MKPSITILLLFTLFQATVYTQVCDPSQFFTGQRCAPCKENCICSSENACTSCRSGYTFDSKYENCVACPTAIDSVNVGCKQCCYQIIETAYVCSSCPSLSNTFLIGGQCIRLIGCSSITTSGRCKACESGYYLFDGQCSPCDASCDTCYDSTFCSTCTMGYFNGTDGNYGLCQACSSGCKTCSDAVTCTVCEPYFRLVTNACTACPANCKTCTNSACTSCSDGFALVSGVCQPCTNTGLSGSAGCLACHHASGQIDCDTCDDHYYLAGNNDCYTCISLFPNSASCTRLKPLQCLNDDHATLSSRYYLVGTSCVANTKNCKTMKNDQGDCSSCYFEEGYYYKLVGTTCDLCVKPGCKTFSTSCQCLSCLPGYQYINSQCIICQNPHCHVCQNNVQSCQECAPYYGIMSSACISCSQSMCLNCDGDTSLCVTCEDAYYNSNGICYECQASCLLCTSSTVCSSCASGYYLDSSSRCKANPSNCVQVDGSGNCLKCSYGYMIKNGNCFACSPESLNMHQCERYCPSYYALLVWETKFAFSAMAIIFLALFM